MQVVSLSQIDYIGLQPLLTHNMSLANIVCGLKGGCGSDTVSDVMTLVGGGCPVVTGFHWEVYCVLSEKLRVCADVMNG